MSQKVLIIAPHPDDETLGCGGTLLKHRDSGDEIYWMIITHVHLKHGWAGDMIRQTENEITQVAQKYGFIKYYNLDFPTMLLDTLPINDLISKMKEVLEEVRPSTVYLPNRSDIHTDHRIVFTAAMSCSKNFRASFIKKRLMYETLSETEFSAPLMENSFTPNVFVDVSGYLDEKLEIFETYRSEIMESPLPRSLDSIEAIARYRGSRIMTKYAEAFMLIEEIL